MNTGAEAVETAIKLARKWGYRAKGVAHDRAEIVVCRNNFHGRTTTIVGFSSEAQYREDFGPFTPGFELVDFGDLERAARGDHADTVAFLVEPIQAEAGIIVPPRGYLAAARALCRERNVLFVLDEIQTGLGRTGKMFAHDHEPGADPDLLVLGKALGGGVYPVSAVLASRAIMTLLRPGDHGSTFGGNPLAAAVGRTALRVLVHERLAERAAEQGEYLDREAARAARAVHRGHPRPRLARRHRDRGGRRHRARVLRAAARARRAREGHARASHPPRAAARRRARRARLARRAARGRA